MTKVEYHGHPRERFALGQAKVRSQAEYSCLAKQAFVPVLIRKLSVIRLNYENRVASIEAQRCLYLKGICNAQLGDMSCQYLEQKNWTVEIYHWHHAPINLSQQRAINIFFGDIGQVGLSRRLYGAFLFCRHESSTGT